MPAEPIPAWAHETLSHLPACVSLDVAARELGLSVPTLRRYIADERLKPLRTAAGVKRNGQRNSGRVLIARAELARLLATLAA